jgi:ABC-type transporter MlaC component
MTITTTVLVDDAEKTITQIVDTVLKRTSVEVAYKPGSAGFNAQALRARAIQAIADCDTAEALINANGWDGLTPAQRKAIALGEVQDIRAIIRVLLGMTDSPS